jgi:hypothetical protein
VGGELWGGWPIEGMNTTTPIPYEDVRELTVTVLRTGVMLSDLLGNLLEDLTDDTFPGEVPADVLIEMLTGTIMPVARTAGERTVRETIALLEAVGDRVLADLRATLDLARGGAP